MKQALILIDEINRKKQAMRETDSQYLKNDYSKQIHEDISELRDYAGFRGLDFVDLMRRIK